MGKTISALVTPEVLIWARNLDRITLEEAARRINVKEEKLASWEAGLANPTLRQAKDLARFYRVPFVYFYLPDSPQKTKRIKPKDFRTFENIGNGFEMSRELRWLMRDIDDRRETVLDLYAMEGRIPIPFDFYLPEDVAIADVAEQMRAFLGLTASKQRTFRRPDKALAYCIERLESNDVLVFQAAKIQPAEMRGMSIGYDVMPIVVLNRKDEHSARLFSLVHELTHIVFRNTGLCNNFSAENLAANDIEYLCNRVAGLVLVPDKELLLHKAVKQIREYGLDDVYVSTIARDFAVSREVIINRLCAVKVITRKTYLETLKRYTDAYAKFAQKKKSGQIPPAIDKGTQVGRLYARTVLSAYHNDMISARDASAYLLNLSTKHFSGIERWCL